MVQRLTRNSKGDNVLELKGGNLRQCRQNGEQWNSRPCLSGGGWTLEKNYDHPAGHDQSHPFLGVTPEVVDCLISSDLSDVTRCCLAR